jgi:hypothetical protein
MLSVEVLKTVNYEFLKELDSEKNNNNSLNLFQIFIHLNSFYNNNLPVLLISLLIFLYCGPQYYLGCHPWLTRTMDAGSEALMCMLPAHPTDTIMR